MERSQQLIDLLGDSPHTVPTLWALMNYHHTRGHRSQARVLVERLVSMAEQAGNIDLELMALAGLGNVAVTQGRFQEAKSASSVSSPCTILPST